LTHKVVLREIKDSIEMYEKGVLDALQLKLDKVELVLNGVQQKAAATSSKVSFGTTN
jgi:hypothetical protein